MRRPDDLPRPIYQLLEQLASKPHVRLSEIGEAGLSDALWAAWPLGVVAAEESALWRLEAAVKHTCYRRLPESFNPALWLSVEGRERLDLHRLWEAGASHKADGPSLPPPSPASDQGPRMAGLPQAETEAAAVAATAEERAPPADLFADLRQFARDKLKGQERAVIEALCDAGGELPIADLAVKIGVGWDDANKGFEGVQRRLNPKTKRLRWKLTRQANAARLTPIPA